MYDSTALAAAELLSHFGKNTAIRIDHKYGRNELQIISARTGNVIREVSLNSDVDLHLIAITTMAQKNFPKPRNMKRSWSPIRLTEAARVESDITRATMNGYYA